LALDNLSPADTLYPHTNLVRQADLELALAETLAERGVIVERGTELVGRAGDPPEVALRAGARTVRVRCRWVAGCDGTGSTVRALAGIARRERGYWQEVLLADVEFAGSLHPGPVGIAGDQPQGARPPDPQCTRQSGDGGAPGRHVGACAARADDPAVAAWLAVVGVAARR
jgi:2-polyprenyl-6-methoxyphenol hydroxylase-like FAD-dependent oxidoreductase